MTRRAGWLLCAPALAVLAIAFAWPMLVLLRMSFNIVDDGGALVSALRSIVMSPPRPNRAARASVARAGSSGVSIGPS